ncbi:hypothetical protein [Pseudoteredinibacter isoporae]|uniref:Uncharacterized protein n=1 Tax=Pseudoteredinibacter isoporae TaxID=570281 RepID=A0A7X0MX28_9GAMM|nr:hypothetical protein [Pseudoteredinibacter isoporae]MBB6521614.1 hypothetical protein [Pseudoteredinibacter isoporae]NHO87168.1 hypothetical protein [Pseudoteredinibacter isoporae]NIB22992.1 hypothetical protein [Pseudoteredinibacter isoporae]
MPGNKRLLSTALYTLLFFALVTSTPAQSFNCQYQLQNWSDAEALKALNQWPRNSKNFILVQAGQVSATLDRAECSRLISWLRRSEAASSAFQLTLYFGKHPGKIISEPTTEQNNVTHYSTDSNRPNSSKARKYLLTIGEETRISQDLWEGKQDTHGLSSAELFLTGDKSPTHTHALSKKPPRKPFPAWLKVKPDSDSKRLFSFTVLQQNKAQLKIKVRQWQFDPTQQRWLEQRQQVSQLALSSWHSLDKVFESGNTKTAAHTNQYSTQKRAPLGRYYFHIDKP